MTVQEAVDRMAAQGFRDWDTGFCLQPGSGPMSASVDRLCTDTPHSVGVANGTPQTVFRFLMFQAQKARIALAAIFLLPPRRRLFSHHRVAGLSAVVGS